MSRRRGHVSISPYLFLLPNLLIFTVFIVIPAISNFFLSFYRTSPAKAPVFIGLENFEYILTIDDLFPKALANLARFAVTDVLAIVLLSVVIGVLLNSHVRGKGIFRSAFFFPVLLSPVVVALVWQWILHSQFGALNAVIQALGGEGVPWLLRPNSARIWVVVVHVWATVGFFALIILAGLQSIPASLYEAARVDGSGNIQSFFRITLPLLTPSIATVTILSMIRAFEIFDHVYILTGGGPGTATMMVIQYVYRASFELDLFGRAAAASLVIFVIVFGLTLLQYVFGRKQEAI